MPHPQAARITKTFPDIVATALTESNCLLPKGFRVNVNDRGAVSLTGTDPLTPAESYAPYFDAITRRLNQSYPTGYSPWLPFSLAPTAVQLAIHSIPIDVLPDDDDKLFPFLKSSIINAKAAKISAARYLNKDRAIRISKQVTSLAVSVDPDDIQKRLPSLFLFSERLKVEKTVNANRYTQCNNCYHFGHASQRCKQTLPCAPSVRFTILVRHKDAKTPPAPREATPGPSQAAAQPPPPTAPTVVATMMPSQENAGLGLPHLQDRRPPPQAPKSPFPTVNKTWKWKTMAVKHPPLPKPRQPRLST